MPDQEHGIGGQDIPWEARIVAVADAYDAMTSDRPYRRALPQSEALRRLAPESGRQFDPQVVECFMELVLHGALARHAESRRESDLQTAGAEKEEAGDETEGGEADDTQR